MKIGTKSMLYGAHCIIIHPVFVAIAWMKLYGWPWDPRYWIAFLVHDLGYLGKSDMDGNEGETHPELGGKIMSFFGQSWAEFCMYHSKYYSDRCGKKPSRLYAADKLAMALEPEWLYMARVRSTGEISEYMQKARDGMFQSQGDWYQWTKKHLTAKAYEYRLREKLGLL